MPLKHCLSTPNFFHTFSHFLSLSCLPRHFPNCHCQILGAELPPPTMKRSGVFAASVAAASATAISASSSSSSNFTCNSNFHLHVEDSKKHDDVQRSASTEKFAPRFDGLRFIETLVTAHR